MPAGKTWYWAGVNQPGRDLVSLEKPPDATAASRRRRRRFASSTASTTERRSALLARAMLIDDQRLTFVEGTVRRSIGAALVEVGAARESNGGTAAHAQMLGKIRRA